MTECVPPSLHSSTSVTLVLSCRYVLGLVGAVGALNPSSDAVVGVLVVVRGAEVGAVSPAVASLVHAASSNLGARLRRRAANAPGARSRADDLLARGARWVRDDRVETCALELRVEPTGGGSVDGERHALAAPVRLAALPAPAGARLVAWLAPGAREGDSLVRPPGGLYPLDIVESLEASGWRDGDREQPAPEGSASELKRGS